MQSLLSEITAQADGIGPIVDVDHETDQLLVLTLAITRIIEQGSLDVSIWGSPDKINWGAKPLAAFSAEVLLRNVFYSPQYFSAA